MQSSLKKPARIETWQSTLTASYLCKDVNNSKHQQPPSAAVVTRTTVGFAPRKLESHTSSPRVLSLAFLIYPFSTTNGVFASPIQIMLVKARKKNSSTSMPSHTVELGRWNTLQNLADNYTDNMKRNICYHSAKEYLTSLLNRRITFWVSSLNNKE